LTQATGTLVSHALQETAQQLLAWARSDENNGPFAEEAYRAHVYIASALNIAAAKIEAGGK
jgi:hypothetical protein